MALAQEGSVLGSLDANVRRAVDLIAHAAREGADLICFPECFLQGYAFSELAMVERVAITCQAAELQPLVDAAAEYDIHVVIGLIERAEDETLYNTALALGPGGRIGRYRKQHLPFMGADRFLSTGDGNEPRVFDTPFGRVGMMICFDLRFPESARALALEGADIIVMPTAWPSTATRLADLVTRVRALENVVYLAVADRADEEAGIDYLGRSQLVDPWGDVVLDAGTEPGLFFAQFSPATSRQKKLTMTRGEYELEIFTARRPELYGALVTPALRVEGKS
ncbi:nitrilase [Aeromicrobium sp. PE09-221]|nr:nitrilase [Aeromicrobium sp. PE09-221]